MSETAPQAPASPAITFTDEQMKAVTASGRDVYVTAAAGSGKTAVLTERVFRLVAEDGDDGRPPVELERLLVITFTRKAAQEMRERIEKRIRKGLELHPDSSALRSALDALPRSNIMTIDAFCDRIVRRHFHLAGVSPAVRLADEEEEREIVHAATREVFEASASGEHGLEEGVFADLLRSTPPSRSGLLEALESRVNRLRAYVASLEDGRAWMQATRETLEAKQRATSLETLPDLYTMEEAIRSEAGEVAEVLEALWNEAVDLAGAPEEIPVHAAWQDAIERLKSWAAVPQDESQSGFAAQWRAMREWLSDEERTGPLKKLHTKRLCGPVVYPELNGLLKKFTSDFAAWGDAWFAHGEDQLVRAERLAGAQALALLSLAEAVEEKAQVLKRRRSLLSFADMQRRALDLLTDGEGPSAVAAQYREFFEYVLVDEYQDVSPLQDALIRRVSRPADPAIGGKGNLFIVGDVKQSIYRFRQAEPALFRERLDAGRAPADDTRPLTLNLSTNFRSRTGVLDGVNRLFEGLMDRRIGDVDMKDDALLFAGRRKNDAHTELSVELQWLDPGDITHGDVADSDNEEGESEQPDAGPDLRTLEAEARWVASRIRELALADRADWIPDESAPGGSRPIRPSDCAILVRSLSRSVDTWIAELARWNITVRTVGGESLWKSPEGEDLLAALRLVDQPFNDLALATFLRSPMGGFSDDDLLLIRMAGGPGAFAEALWRMAQVRPEEESPEIMEALRERFVHLHERIRIFMVRLNRWRDLALKQSAESVLDALLEDTAYEAHVMGGPRADAALRNIDELRTRMRTRERQSSHAPALADFLRTLDLEGGAAPEKEDESLRHDPDAVQLMTIHKSKGLEFPVVFLAQMAQPYQKDARSGALLFSPRGSIALAAVDPARRIRFDPPSLSALYSLEARAVRGEEVRLLYVAMTRARERLVLVGCGRGLHKQAERNASLMELGAPAPASARVRAHTPAALVGPRLHALSRQSAPAWLHIHEESVVPPPPGGVELDEIRIALAQSESVSDSDWRDALRMSAERYGRPVMKPEAAAGPPPLASPAALEYFTRTPLKVRPSQLTAARIGAEDPETPPAFEPREIALFDELEMQPVRWESEAGDAARRFSLEIERESLDPMQRGSLTHAFLQHLNLRSALDADGLRREADRLFDEGLLGIRECHSLEAIPYQGIAAFFETDLGRRLAARPGSVTREMPFARWIGAGALRELGNEWASVDPDRLVTVQGVIDCVLDEGDRVTLIDYKTDSVHDDAGLDRLNSKYAPQIAQYAAALQSAWRLDSPPDCFIVFLQIGRVVPMNDRIRTD